jgi:hypothetical protein
MLSISHTTYPDRTLDFELWLRYLAMGGKELNEWLVDFERFCYVDKGMLKKSTRTLNGGWRLKPHYQHGTNKIVDVELWKGANDYVLSFEEKAILVKILKRKL